MAVTVLNKFVIYGSGSVMAYYYVSKRLKPKTEKPFILHCSEIKTSCIMGLDLDPAKWYPDPQHWF
jgi:hypothetical protein